MAFKVQDFIKETSSTSGTGDLACGGAVTNYSSFASYLSNNDTTIYAASLGTQWETGIGTYNSGTNAIARTTILTSSTGTIVSFSGGIKTLICGFASQLYANVQVSDGTATSGTKTLDASLYSHKLTVGGAFTFAVSNWGPTGTLSEIEIELVNGASSTITWPTVNWVKGDGTVSTTFSTMSVTLATSGTNTVMLWTTNGGTTVYGKAG
jgi:hypothetical protein